MTRRRSSLGLDPLDWIGVAPERAPGGGNDDGGGDGRERLDAARGARTAPDASATTASAALVDAPASPAPPSPTVRCRGRRPEGAAGGLPVFPGADAATLERELLLMDVREVTEEPGRRGRFNQVLLFLTFAFALCGSAILFFREARSRWNDQVLTLQGTIDKLETERRENDSLLHQVLVSKDRVIGDHERIIADLQALHRKSVTDLRETWDELRELQERYSRFFTIVFSNAGIKAASPTTPGGKDDSASAAGGGSHPGARDAATTAAQQ